MKTYKDNTFSMTEFEGYKFRVRLIFRKLDDFEREYLDLYTTTDDREIIVEFVEDHKTDKATFVKIEFIFTKEQDDKQSELIQELIKDL